MNRQSEPQEMLMLLYRFVAAIILVVLTLASTSCTAQMPTGMSVEEPQIDVGVTQSAPIEIARETVHQNNCGGTAEADNVIERARAVVETLEVSSELGVNADGRISLFGTGVNLGSAVASKLGKSYGATEQIKRSITVRTAAHSRVEYVISLQEVWNVGEAKVHVNGEVHVVPYRFRSDFQLELVDSVERSCPASTVASETTENQPTATSTHPIEPKTVSAYYDRGHAYYDRGDYDKAIADYTQVITLAPQYANPYINRGNAYAQISDYDKAITDYIQALTLEPENTSAYYDRGIAYDSKGDYDKAITDYTQAIVLDPKLVAAYINRGVAYTHKGDKPAATEDYQKAADLYQQQGNTSGYQDALKRITELRDQ